MAPALDRLTERERAALRLLAAGHDVKSAATVLETTPTAVAERLREARRKLGVTSSREAARLLQAHENGCDTPKIGDHFSGIGDTAPAVAGEAPGTTRPAWRRPLLVAIAGGLMLAILLAVALNSTGPEPTAPRVIATSPAEGEQIAAGPFQLSVTFDQPMAPGSFSFVQVDPARYPDCARTPSQSADGRSFILSCRARAGASYEIWFNRAPYLNFRAVDGAAAIPHRLQFQVR